jgi:hypothetical protein
MHAAIFFQHTQAIKKTITPRSIVINSLAIYCSKFHKQHIIIIRYFYSLVSIHLKNLAIILAFYNI